MGRRMDGSVYCIYCAPTKRTYVGVTCNVETRVRDHLQELRAGKKKDPITNQPSIWQKDYDKYGEEAFTGYVLETDVTWDKRTEREGYWIAKYQSTDPKHGYNFRQERKTLILRMAEGRPPEPETEAN